MLRGKPEQSVPEAVARWSATRLCYEADHEPYSKVRDAQVTAAIAAAAASEGGGQQCCEVRAHVSHTLYDPERVAALSPNGRPPLTMQSFQRLVDTQLGDPPAPVADPPTRMPPVDESVVPADEEGVSRPPRSLREAGFPIPAAAGAGAATAAAATNPSSASASPPPAAGADTPTANNRADEDRLLAPASAYFPGGETAALARLEKALADDAWVCAFDKPSTDPTAFDGVAAARGPSTTVLSPYLKFGCLSARLFHAKLQEAYARVKRKGGTHTKPPTSLRGQLLWREFFYAVGSATPNFSRMQGNPICRQIDWDDDPVKLAAWREGRTGFPWIDAAMRQLREVGWLHHLARHAVACFLTRGDLYLSWERGQEVFEELLLDQDTAINTGNWLWLSASAFFSQYYRVYSPVSFAKKYDPTGKYIRRWLPVLSRVPDKYIYEPWTAPLEVQRAAGCIIGRDYPFPIVDHTSASKANMARMKAAYAAGGAGAGSEEAGEGAAAGGKPAAAAPKKQKKDDAGAAAAAGGKKQRTLTSMLKPPAGKNEDA